MPAGTRGDAESIDAEALRLLYPRVMRAHGAGALLGAPRVALMRIRVRVILNFIVPRLDMESWRPVPEGAKSGHS